MGIVEGVTGFAAALIEGFKAIWMFLKFFYQQNKEMLALIFEEAVTAFYGFLEIIDIIWNKIKGVFQALKDFVYHVLFGGTITKDFKKAFDFIEKLVVAVLETIFKIFKEFKNLVRVVLEGVATVFETIFTGITAIVQTLGDVVVGVFDSIGKQIKGILQAFIEMAKVIERIFGKVLELGGKAL